jgi:GNAT superfamily N-acetyltransferase
MRLALATENDFNVVIDLIKDAARWLQATKDTDQWARPWPDKEARDERVRKGLKGEKTWIVWDGGVAAATLTMATGFNPAVWSKPKCQCDLRQRAVYLHRLITRRSYAGLGLGKQLIDWAGSRARREYGAKWTRIDVWSTNRALHAYYLGLGFKPCGTCADPGYPSGALFERPIPKDTVTARLWFTYPPLRRRPPRRNKCLFTWLRGACRHELSFRAGQVGT